MMDMFSFRKNVLRTLFFCLLLLQLFWERKLSGLNAFDIAEELVKTMDLPKGLQGEDNQSRYDNLV